MARSLLICLIGFLYCKQVMDIYLWILHKYLSAVFYLWNFVTKFHISLENQTLSSLIKFFQALSDEVS